MLAFQFEAASSQIGGYTHAGAGLYLEQSRFDEAADRIRTQTWAYARRQRTWFRHQLPSDAVRLDASLPTDQLAQQIVQDWREAVLASALQTEQPVESGRS